MSQDSDAPTPPDGLPDSTVAELNDLSPENLRKTIVHARELLQLEKEYPSPVKPTPGEDVIRVAEHDAYTEVVKTVSCNEGCRDCPHGPYLYHVSEEQRPEGGSHTHWRFIGEVAEEDSH